jgi:hypothetical protein
LFIWDHKFGKAAIEARQNFGKQPNDWFCKTIKSGETESKFAIQSLRMTAATTSAIHNIPLQYCFTPIVLLAISSENSDPGHARMDSGSQISFLISVISLSQR